MRVGVCLGRVRLRLAPELGGGLELRVRARVRVGVRRGEVKR